MALTPNPINQAIGLGGTLFGLLSSRRRPLTPGYAPGSTGAADLMREGSGQAVRNALGVATAGGGGLAGARAGAEAGAQQTGQMAYQAAQLRAQEANAEAQRRQAYLNQNAELNRGLLSGFGGAMGATQQRGQSPLQTLSGVAGAVAPLLLASDRRLKQHIRTASPEEVMRIRDLLLQRAQGQDLSPAEQAGIGKVMGGIGRPDDNERPHFLRAPGGRAVPNPAAIADPAARAPYEHNRPSPPVAPAPGEATLGELAARRRESGRPLGGGPVPMRSDAPDRHGSAMLLAARANRRAREGAEVGEDPAMTREETDPIVAEARRLGGVQPRSFQGPNGPVGVIAQEVSRAAPSLVGRAAGGVMGIPVGQGLSVALAGQSDHERRLRALEQIRKARKPGGR